MDRFQVIEDAAGIVLAKGIYRQVKLFSRGGNLYAGHGSGFIRLYRGGSTSLPNVAWKDLDLSGGALGEESLGLTYRPALSVAAE